MRLLIAAWLLAIGVFARDWEIHVTNAENGVAEFEENTNAHLSCSVTNLPAGSATPEIHWIDINSQVIKSRFMVWHHLGVEHEGKYKCVVTVDGEEAREIVELKVHKYPKFLTMQHDQHFEIGSTARLQYLFWTRNDLPVVQNERIQFEDFGSTLIIQNFTTSDNDLYACNLPKANSFDTFSFNVAAMAKAKILQFVVPEVVLEGRDAVLKCEFTGLPWPKLRVYKATTSINNELIVASEKYQFNGNILIISNVTAQDIGEYTCSVENFVNSENATVQLTVDTKPRIRHVGQLYANVDDTKNVSCSATGKNVTLTWYTNQFNLITCDDMINEQKYSCVDNGTRSTLIYRNVSESDSRKFTCVATNAAGKDVWDFEIELTKEPVIVKHEPAVVRVVSGTKLELTCQATAIPVVEWTWYQDNQPILGVTDTFFVNSTENNISVLTAKFAQAGNFSCEAKNVVGTARSAHTEVLIVEPPQLPEIECDKDIPLPNRANCHGNFDIIPRERLPTSFRVELIKLDGPLLSFHSEANVPFTGNDIVVRPLNTSTEYRARFKALNEAGESNWSDPQQFETGSPTEPEPVSNIHWQCDEAKCSFSWTAGDNNGLPIVGYTVQVSQPNNTQDDGFDNPVFEDTISDSSVGIYSLTANAFYKFRVRASNEIGASEYTITEFQVGDQPANSAILTIVLVCLLILIIVAAAVFMLKCRKKLGGKSTVLNDPSSAEEGQTLVPQTAETKLV
ncbi:hypothetical protein M3Y97_00865500 [Aphelenchoides bicaudatus]|nr:hypothetical protein M3Y97_00865500 [Aphelenchoides bicaudatus]